MSIDFYHDTRGRDYRALILSLQHKPSLMGYVTARVPFNISIKLIEP